MRGRTTNNCWGWQIGERDYRSQWAFRINFRNDDIYYHNRASDIDYTVDIDYEEISLEES